MKKTLELTGDGNRGDSLPSSRYIFSNAVALKKTLELTGNENRSVLNGIRSVG